MIRYQYQIIRYMPDQFAGEFGNIGIVVYAEQEQFLGCRVTGRYSRLSGFFGEINGSFLLAALHQFEAEIKKLAASPETFLGGGAQLGKIEQITSSVLPKDDSALQLTGPLFGTDVNAGIALDDLFDRLVDKYNTDTSGTRHTDHYAWSKIYKSYFDSQGLTGKLQKHTVSTSKDHIDFDKAWKNGVWNCYQALSFDLKSEDAIKSKVYKWSGIIRELETSQEDLHLYFLTTSPREHEGLNAFISDKLTLKDDSRLSVEVVTEDRAASFAEDVRIQMEGSNIIKGDYEVEDDLPF